MVFIRARLRPRGSTAFVENRIAQLWTLRDGKATRCEVLYDGGADGVASTPGDNTVFLRPGVFIP